MPKRGVLSMHCSATADQKTGRSSLLFGLSGTGKTTLSADPEAAARSATTSTAGRDDGIFNIEGGCYAKAIDLTPETEPDIFQALRFGAVLENVVLDDATAHVDFDDTSITENTRGAYPIEFIRNAKIPCVAGHPDRRHLPDLRCLRRAAAGQQADAGPGDVPLHQRLHGQGRRHRDGRHRAAGDVLALLRRAVPGLAPGEVRRAARRRRCSSTRPTSGSSTPAGAAAAYGTGKRMKLTLTRAIIDAIHSGQLADGADHDAIRSSDSTW